jgi:uncharacterized membrane protein YkvA (DUF1232 family)
MTSDANVRIGSQQAERHVLSKLKQWARALKRDAYAVYFAARDPRVPWLAKALGIAVAAYAFSPIDLIPDFIPVVGYLDELIILPLGIALAVRLIPPEVLAEHRARAEAAQERPVSFAAAAAIVVVWLVALLLTALAVRRYFWDS